MVTLLVGPQGAGKSTFANGYNSQKFIISQDEMGQKGHLEEYKRILASFPPNSAHIIIDRINHTREQRERYTSLAKEAGWNTEIIVMNAQFDVCLDRITKRVGHPTIQDKSTAIKALKTYFFQYERPTIDEADSVTYMRDYDPYLLNLNHLYPFSTRFIVITDPHGCYDELMELLEKVEYVKGQDVIIFGGDLTDRGPKIREVLDFAMNTPRVHSTMGNHDNKLARYLSGMLSEGKSKVNTKSHGFKMTLDQCGDMLDERLLSFLFNMPMIIRFNDNYVFHAGINPRYPITRQNREFLMYARKFNPATNSFDDENFPYWYEYNGFHESYSGKTLLFGHEVHEKEKYVHRMFSEPDKKSCIMIPMDAGCVFGNKLRAMVFHGDRGQMFSVDSRQPKANAEPLYSNWAEPYENKVNEGYLNKNSTEDLVLYNYTDKCVYEKWWDKYTLESRGLIFEKSTGKVIARPFPKFFNLGESQTTQLSALPNEPYECFEKMDGSLGIVFHYKGKWQVATRGSFTSPQALRATEMVNTKYNMKDISTEATLLVEIIYPENRNMAGARLVVNYGEEEFLSLLGAYDRNSGLEIPYASLDLVSIYTGMKQVTKFPFTIEQMIEMQKTLPADKEGFVVRFQSGLRVKIKGEEYMKMHRILNSITPLFFWEMMSESEDFAVPGKYLASIPEEYTDEALDLISRLKNKRAKILAEVEEDFAKIPIEKPDNVEDKAYKRELGMWLQANHSQLRHGSLIFPYVLNNKSAIEKHLRKLSRPTGNVLE